MGKVEPAVDPHCKCGRVKVVRTYIDSLGQRTGLKLKRQPFTGTPFTEPFVEPYPGGNRANLLACTECDYADRWPSRLKPRKKKS